MASDSEKRTQKDTLGDCVKTCSCSGFKTVNVRTNPENTYGIDDVSKHTDVNNVNLDVNCCNTFRLPMSGTDIDYAKVSEMFPAEPPSTDCCHDTTNTVDTPVDCTNTYNLATRGFVFSLLSSHDKCRNSHKEVIDELRKMISETGSSISAPDIYGDYPFFKIAADGTMLYMGKDDRVFRASEALETFSTKLDSAAALKDKWDIETHGKYYIGQKVSYNGRLYECTVINTDTVFNPLHWKELTLQEEIDDKRDKNDYRVYRRKKDIWRWSALKQEGYADTPDDFLETANLINAPYPIFNDNVGEWTYEPQFWPNGKRKYFQQIPPVGDKFAYSINWVFSAYAEDGKTELFRFYATSVREETTDETLVYEDIQRIRIATTENVEKEVRKETIRAEAEENALSERVSSLEGNRDRWNAAATEIESTSANNRSVFTSVRATSGDWNKTHDAVTASSDKWNSVYTSVSSTSGGWDDATSLVKETSGSWNRYVSLTQLRPLLYEVTYDGYDWDIAREFFEKEYPVDASLSKPTFTSRPMACASVRKGNFHGRNLDWYYDWEPEFIVRVSRKEDDAGHLVRHSSYGFVSVIPGLTDGIAASKSGKIFGGDTEYNIYDIIPFLAVDGQNDTGLVVNANVAPAFERGRTTGNQNPSSDLKLCQTQIVRYILDNFSTAQEAADFFSKTGTSDGPNVYGVYNDKIQTEMHFMVSDSSNTFVIEWIDNIPRVTEIPIMTNFHVSDIERDADGHVVVEEGKIEPHAIGIERFNLASDEMESVETMDDMAVLMRNLFYTRAYKSSPNPSNPYWYSEFVGETETFGDLTVFTPHEEFDKPGGIVEFVDNSYRNRSRDNREPDNSTWHTTHSIVYDIANKKAIFITQEGEFGDSYIELTPNSTLPYSGLYLLDKTLRDYTNRKHAELSLMLARDAVSIAGVENTEFKNFRGIQELDRRSKRLVAVKSNKSDFELIRGIPHADYVNSLFKIENTTLSGTILDVSAPSITAALTGKQNTLTTEQLSSIDKVPVLSAELSGKQNVLSTAQLSSIEAVPAISTTLSRKQDTLSTEQLSSISAVSSIASELSGKANKSDLMKYDPVTDEWYIEIEE